MNAVPAAGMRQAWVAPTGWPPAPAGWSPPPGWRPDPSWPTPPADWRWWQSRLDPRRFLRAWRFLATVIATWVLGNIALTAWIWHQAAVGRRFWLNPTPGSDFGTPVAVVLGVFALTATVLVIGIAWLATFGAHRPGLGRTAIAGVLCAAALAADGYLLQFGDAGVGPGQPNFSINASNRQYHSSAAIAAVAALVGLVLLLVALRGRRVLLLDSASHLDLS
jgi:hypothetical protein